MIHGYVAVAAGAWSRIAPRIMPATTSHDCDDGDVLDQHRLAVEKLRAVNEHLSKKVTRARNPRFGVPQIAPEPAQRESRAGEKAHEPPRDDPIVADDLLLLRALHRLPPADEVARGTSVLDAPTREALVKMTSVDKSEVSKSLNWMEQKGLVETMSFSPGYLKAGEGGRAGYRKGTRLTGRGRKLFNWVFPPEDT